MLADDRAAQLFDSEAQDDEPPHPLDRLVPDPTGRSALGSEAEFTAHLNRLVRVNLPRVFAVVQVYGERVDRCIAGWGLDFGDHAEVISTDRTVRMGLNSPEEAMPGFRYGTHIRPRIVWADADQ